MFFTPAFWELNVSPFRYHWRPPSPKVKGGACGAIKAPSEGVHLILTPTVNGIKPLTPPPLARSAGQRGRQVQGGFASYCHFGNFVAEAHLCRKRKISLPLGKGATATEKSPLSLSFRAKREIPKGERVLSWGSLHALTLGRDDRMGYALGRGGQNGLRSVGMTEWLALGRDDRMAYAWSG